MARERVRIRPELTVVVTSGTGHEATVRSLDAQRLGRRLEVRNLPGPPVTALLEAAATTRGSYVTVLAAGDTVAAGWGSALLDAVRPDAVTFARTRGALVDLSAEALRTVRGVVLPVAAARAASVPDAPGPVAETELLAAILVGRPRVFCARASAVLIGAEVTVDVAAAVAAAERVARTPDLEVAVAAITAVVGAIDPALRADAAARDAVRDRLRHVPGFVPAAVNHGLARDLAILYVSLPFSDTAGNIAARRIRERGLLVDVVSADLSRHRSIDRSAEPLWDEYVDEHVVLSGRSTVQGEWGPIVRFCRDGAQAITSLERTKGPYRSVYSRTMFPGAHLLAAGYKLNHPDTPWLAEFSDPQLRNPRGETRQSKGEPDRDLLDRLAEGLRARGLAAPTGDNVWEWAETVTYALADTVLFTNEHQRDYMLGYCADPAIAGRAREHAAVSHHPSPSPQLYTLANSDYWLEPGQVHVGYFGNFYPTRSLGEVLSALTELDVATRDRVRLHVFTRRPQDVRDTAGALGVGEAVIANGYIPFADYLALTQRLDVLLVNDYVTAGALGTNPFLPAKYADYRVAGTAVWGIVEPGSVLSGLPLAHRSDLGDVAGAAAVWGRLAQQTG